MKKVIAGALGAVLAFHLGITRAQELKGEYRLGVLEPLTGNLAVQGKLHLEGYEIMRDLINTRFGGVMGRKLVLVVGDAPDPTAAASEATRLATRERVKIITGTFSSTLCGAASEAASASTQKSDRASDPMRIGSPPMYRAGALYPPRRERWRTKS